MYASKRNSTSTLDVSQLDAVSQLCLTVSRRHSDAELIDSPTDDEQSSPTTPINSEAPYHMSVAAHSSSDISSLHTKVQPSSASQTSDSKSKRVFTFPTISCSTTEKPVRASTLISDSSHSKLCRYFCSEENSSLCPSKQQTTTSNIETPISPVLKNKPFKRSLFSSKKGRPVSAIFATQKFTDDTLQQTVSHARSQSGGDSSSFTAPTPSLDRSSSTSSTLSSHESFQSDRIVNIVNATDELSPVTDVDSGSETITTWSSERSSFNTNVHNSAPVSAASSPRLSPIESHRKGIFSKRANTQPAMTIDITSSPKPSKGLKAAIRNKRETAVLKREAKAIQVWRSSTLTLLYSGPDKPTAQDLTKVIYPFGMGNNEGLISQSLSLGGEILGTGAKLRFADMHFLFTATREGRKGCTDETIYHLRNIHYRKNLLKESPHCENSTYDRHHSKYNTPQVAFYSCKTMLIILLYRNSWTQ